MALFTSWVLPMDLVSVYTNNNHSSPEKWQVTCIDHKTINGIRIPVKNNVTWKLKEGDFKWLELEITNIQFTFTT